MENEDAKKAECVERTANWAAPLPLLYLRGLPKKLKEFFM